MYQEPAKSVCAGLCGTMLLFNGQVAGFRQGPNDQ